MNENKSLHSTNLSALLKDLLGLHSEDGVEGVGEHVPRGERVLEERVGLPPLLPRMIGSVSLAQGGQLAPVRNPW